MGKKIGVNFVIQKLWLDDAMKELRFGDVSRHIQINQRVISYNHLSPAPRCDENGQVIATAPKPIRLRPIDIYRLLRPYIGSRFYEQFRSVVPLGLYLIIFQLLILRQVVEGSWAITGGLFAVILGLMFFMEGLKLGLMPFGEMIGNRLPKKSTLPLVLLISFLLGIGVTFAEPAIGALQAVGAGISPEKAPYLYALLNLYTTPLVLMVGIGVGLAAVLGTVRFIYGWSLKPMIYLALIPTLTLTILAMGDDQMAKTLGLAWDAGAVTTGPVTVPLVLSLGIGIAAAAGKGSSSLSGFGIVTLASLFPIVAVLILSFYVSWMHSPEDILALAQASQAQTTSIVPWYAQTPYVEILLGIRAIVPLVLFLALVFFWILKEKLKNPGEVLYGLILTLLGMIIFNIGLTYGLANLGTQTGGTLPAAFQPLEGFEQSPIYWYGLGVLIAIAFAFTLGFGATLAEPALNALGMTVENLTHGAFKKSMLMMSVSVGVGTGIALGVVKILYDIPVAYFLIPAYLLAVLLTYLSSESYVNVAWDSAGVTTGPVTVPLVLAMGVGIGNAVSVQDGFGVLSLASIGPILSVLTLGLIVEALQKRKELPNERAA